MSTEPLQRPIDPVLSIGQAIILDALDPDVFQVNIRNGDPPMYAPWEHRMDLDGATMFVHPEREAEAIAAAGW